MNKKLKVAVIGVGNIAESHNLYFLCGYTYFT